MSERVIRLPAINKRVPLGAGMHHRINQAIPAISRGK